MYHLVAKQGYDKTSLAQVAAAVDIQKPSLYHHFKSKEEIFLATIDKYYCQLIMIDNKQIDILETQVDYHEFFLKYGLKVLSDFANNRELRLFCDEINLQEQRNPVVADYLSHNDTQTISSIRELVQRGVVLGCFPPDFPIETEVHTVMALLIGLSEVLLFRIEINTQIVWEHHVERLFQAF